MSPLVFDVGMYDGADTAYYLHSGCRVVAIEANPDMVEKARERFSEAVASGALTLVGAALSDAEGTVTLHLPRHDLGSSTTRANVYKEHELVRTVSARAITIKWLIETYGRPHFIKCDIEGADRYCVLGLEAATAPEYLSFEMGADVEELLAHLDAIGFHQFRIVDQLDFKELETYRHISSRLRNRLRNFRLRTVLGPDHTKIDGHKFLRKHSAGPMPEFVPGHWWSREQTVKRWTEFNARRPADRWFAWYDVHARRTSGHA